MLLRTTIALLALLALAPPALRAQPCAGDCSGDGQVAINELVTCVAFALAGAEPAACTACDANGDDAVAIADLIAGVNAALNGCETVDLPDLVPLSVRLSSDTPACINDTSEIRLRLEICVANEGTAAAPASSVELLGEEVGRVDGIAAGGQACLITAFVPFDIDVRVDAREEIAETDERNNFAFLFVPLPTPPPFCDATPTVTDTPPPTDTPAATETETPSATATASDTPVPTNTPVPTDTATPVATDTPLATETPVPTATLVPTATGVPTGTATATAPPGT